MKNRTFCILLAICVMVLGTVAALLKKAQPEQQPDAMNISAAAQQEEREQLCMPVEEWHVEQAFGAEYSEEYGQWALNEELWLKTTADSPVYAPLSGKVAKVTAWEDGGSMLTLTCVEEITLELGPIRGVRVFPGSTFRKMDVLGIAGERMLLRAYQSGQAVDPMVLAE